MTLDELRLLRTELRRLPGHYKTTPFLPLSDPFNGSLKRPTQKANSLAPAKALRDGDGARKPKP